MYYNIFIEYCAGDLSLTGLFKFSCGENQLLIMTLMISDKKAMLRNKTRSFDYVLY